MPLEQPHRLKIPSPDARVARTPFPDGEVFADASDIKVTFVPIVQWGDMRIRGKIDGAAGTVGLEFARPKRQLDPALLPGASEAFVYTVDQPGADGTAWVSTIEFFLDITAAEHAGENWLKITLDPAGGAVIDFFDISGTLLGTYH